MVDILCIYSAWLLFRSKDNIPNVIVLTVASLLCLIILNYAYPFFSKDVEYRQRHTILHHGFVPNSTGSMNYSEYNVTYVINEHGLRSPPITDKGNRTRILVLGDSFTEGYGVEYNESVSARIQYYLGESYDVINAGVASYSPTLEYLYLKYYGLDLSPDIVILNLDNSDLQDDNHLYPPYTKFNSENEPIAVYDPGTIFKKLYLIVNDDFYSLIQKDSSQVGDSHFDRYFHTRYESCDKFAFEWSITLSYLKRIKNLAEDNNITLYIVIYPYGHQVSTNQWKGRVDYFFEANTTYPFALPDCFERYNDNTSFVVFNTMPYFLNESDKKLFFDTDTHFTPAGHDVLARATVDFIRQKS
ncbi:MAG: hypothetical protein ACP5NW_00190 [Candidatus Woesearchaeota archaeon]